MDICRYLNRYVDYNNPIFEKRIEELGLVNPLGSDKLVTISHNETALHAFQRLAALNLLAAPVVDDAGVICGNLSASDVRGITRTKLPWVELPVLKFLDKMNASCEGKGRPVPLTCSSRSQLKEIIPALIAAHVHRVWVVNSARVPIGVVTLTDIIQTLLSSFENAK
jgi:CBS-domain-containing membrane protein